MPLGAVAAAWRGGTVRAAPSREAGATKVDAMHATEEEVPCVIAAVAAAAKAVPPSMEGLVQAPQTVVTVGEAFEGA